MPLNPVSDLSQQRNGCGSECDGHLAACWHIIHRAVGRWGPSFMNAYIADTRTNDRAGMHQLREQADSHFMAVHAYYVKISSSGGTGPGDNQAAVLDVITQVKNAREDMQTLATTEALIDRCGTMRS